MISASGWSESVNTSEAVRSILEKIESDLAGKPDWLVVSLVSHDCREISSILGELVPGVPIHGGTSCKGVMTEEGFHSVDGVGMGMFGLRDPSGSYGTAVAIDNGAPRDAGRMAVRDAIAAARTTKEKPELIWLTCAPGFEEEVIKGIEEITGGDIPIAGGSSADNSISGDWKQFTAKGAFSNGIVVSALFPSTKVHCSFYSGYNPTEKRGRVTSGSRRVIHTIDNKPASEVYNDWTDGAISDSLRGGTILADTTLYPLGKPLKKMGKMDFYCLSHPESVTSGGGLKFFTEFEDKEDIVLMTGSKSRLVDRAGMVARSALRSGGVSVDDIAGGLVIFCAGCMLTVEDRMSEAVSNISETLGSNPFLGAFTFGEQGPLVDGANHHGNLMISVVLFERKA